MTECRDFETTMEAGFLGRRDDHVRHQDLLSGPVEARARIELLQQSGTGVVLLGDRLQGRGVGERGQLRFLHHVLGHRREGPGDVLRRDRDANESRSRVGVQDLPGLFLDDAAAGQAVSRLKVRDRAAQVGAVPRVDLPAGEVRAGEQDLGPENGGAGGAGADDFVSRRIVDGGGIDHRLGLPLCAMGRPAVFFGTASPRVR